MIRDSRHGVSKTGAKIKKYVYSYYYTARTYHAAVAKCKKKGQEWDVASFQAVFDYKDGMPVLKSLAQKSFDNIM